MSHAGMWKLMQRLGHEPANFVRGASVSAYKKRKLRERERERDRDLRTHRNAASLEATSVQKRQPRYDPLRLEIRYQPHAMVAGQLFHWFSPSFPIIFPMIFERHLSQLPSWQDYQDSWTPRWGRCANFYVSNPALLPRLVGGVSHPI